jgi:hypothetical protein
MHLGLATQPAGSAIHVIRELRIMRVRCVSDYVTEEQRAALGRRKYRGSLEPGLSIGAEYLVLGMTFEADPRHVSTGPYVMVLMKDREPATYDLCLFEIIDPRVSRYWEVHTVQFDGRQIVDVRPLALFGPLDITDDDERDWEKQEEAYDAFLNSDAFRDTCALLRAEFADTP